MSIDRGLTSTGTVTRKQGIMIVIPCKSEIIKIYERSLILDIYISTHRSFPWPEPEGTGREKTGASAMENPERMDATGSLI